MKLFPCLQVLITYCPHLYQKGSHCVRRNVKCFRNYSFIEDKYQDVNNNLALCIFATKYSNTCDIANTEQVMLKLFFQKRLWNIQVETYKERENKTPYEQPIKFWYGNMYRAKKEEMDRKNDKMGRPPIGWKKKIYEDVVARELKEQNYLNIILQMQWTALYICISIRTNKISCPVFWLLKCIVKSGLNEYLQKTTICSYIPNRKK